MKTTLETLKERLEEIYVMQERDDASLKEHIAAVDMHSKQRKELVCDLHQAIESLENANDNKNTSSAKSVSRNVIDTIVTPSDICQINELISKLEYATRLYENLPK